MDAITKEILALFEEINTIPRCSGHEENIANWLKEQALSAGLGFKFDSVNNVLISVPASPGYETLPAVILQGHMDMVCEKTQASVHDFSRDPISHIIEGDWLRADGTTLGADNGIALAMALVLARHREIPHPPLELLFTVDEENGLTGANELMPDFISGKTLLNLDSEEEGVFITGCAGGLTTTISLPLERTPLPVSHKVYRLAVTGLAGGHSGMDIHERRANANKLLAAVLGSLMDNTDLHVLSLSGGSAHNAIPRHAEALVSMPPENIERAEATVMRAEEEARKNYAEHDTSLSVTLSMQDENEGLQAIPHETAKMILFLLNELPHGAAIMSADMPGLVQTSSNLGIIRTESNQLIVVASQRSSISSELQEITGKITSTARSMGAEVRHGSSYPAWQPDPSSSLTRRCKEVYTETFSKEPAIEVIHAGLECAVIGSRYPGMEMISFGPTIRNPHSPEERLYIPSVSRVWNFLLALLVSFKEDSRKQQE